MSPILAELDSGMYLLLAVLCLVMLSVSLWRRTRDRQTTARDVTRDQLARLRDQRELKVSMDELLVQLEEVSRRINAQVDTRFMKLESVVRDADERIARLEALTQAPDPNSPETSQKPRNHEPTTPSLPQNGTSTTPTTSAESQSEDPPARQSFRERRQRICEMSDAGAAPMTIADALRIPLGEVELVLSMRDFK